MKGSTNTLATRAWVWRRSASKKVQFRSASKVRVPCRRFAPYSIR